MEMNNIIYYLKVHEGRVVKLSPSINGPKTASASIGITTATGKYFGGIDPSMMLRCPSGSVFVGLKSFSLDQRGNFTAPGVGGPRLIYGGSCKEFIPGLVTRPHTDSSPRNAVTLLTGISMDRATRERVELVSLDGIPIVAPNDKWL